MYRAVEAASYFQSLVMQLSSLFVLSLLLFQDRQGQLLPLAGEHLGGKGGPDAGVFCGVPDQ